MDARHTQFHVKNTVTLSQYKQTAMNSVNKLCQITSFSLESLPAPMSTCIIGPKNNHNLLQKVFKAMLNFRSANT